MTPCDFCGPIGRCIYVSGHGGEHFQDDRRADYSDEIRLRLLRDAWDAQDATITALTKRAEAAEREAERLRHGIPIESDFICPNELPLSEALAVLRAGLREALDIALAEALRSDYAPHQPTLDRIATLRRLAITALTKRAEAAEREGEP